MNSTVTVRRLFHISTWTSTPCTLAIKLLRGNPWGRGIQEKQWQRRACPTVGMRKRENEKNEGMMNATRVSSARNVKVFVRI